MAKKADKTENNQQEPEKKKRKPREKKEPELQVASIRFCTNVLSLAHYQGKNIGKMEVECGLGGKGYLAQYRKGKFMRGIPLDIAFNLAEFVGKDVDDLIRNDYTNMRNKDRVRRVKLDTERMKKELSGLWGDM